MCGSIRLLIWSLNLGVSSSLIINGYSFLSSADRFSGKMKYFSFHIQKHICVITALSFCGFTLLSICQCPLSMCSTTLRYPATVLLNTCPTAFLLMKALISGISKAPEYHNFLTFCNKSCALSYSRTSHSSLLPAGAFLP